MKNKTQEKNISNWRFAQSQVAELLKKNNFSIWEEYRINKKNRVDILAKRKIREDVVYIIVEVKDYKKVTGNDEKRFMDQLKNYVKELIIREKNRLSLEKILLHYTFIGYLIVTNDFGLYKKRKKNWLKGSPFPIGDPLNSLWKRNVHIFYSTQDHLYENLKAIGIMAYQNTTILNFFPNNGNNLDKNK